MSITTPIAWCDSTANGGMGCDGCELWNGLRRSCYAGILTERRAGRPGYPPDFATPTLFPRRIPEACRWPDLTGTRRPNKPWLDGMPRVVFLGDMGDNHTESLDLRWLAPYVPAMEKSPHQWLDLTKRPKRAAQFWNELMPARNIWVGTSITNQATADARLPWLSKVCSTIHFVSAEPLLEEVDLSRWIWDIDWVIVGGESGTRPMYRPMDSRWALLIRDQCQDAGIAFFFKQHSGPHSEMGPALEGREYREMPKAWSESSERL